MNSEQTNEGVNPKGDGTLENDGSSQDYQQEASKFINDTSLDKMIEIAEIAKMKKLSEPPKWVIPDEI